MMDQALEGVEPAEFGEPPPELEEAVHLTVRVPDVAGTDTRAALAVLADAGFATATAPTRVASDQAAGTVDHTSPAAGASVRAGSEVTVHVRGKDERTPRPGG